MARRRKPQEPPLPLEEPPEAVRGAPGVSRLWPELEAPPRLARLALQAALDRERDPFG